MNMWVDKLLCMGGIWYIGIFALPSTPKWLSEKKSPSRSTSQFSKKVSIFSYEQHPWLGDDLGFVVHIPWMCSPYHLGIGSHLEALQRSGTCLGVEMMHLGSILRVGWPTGYPEKEEKSLFETVDGWKKSCTSWYDRVLVSSQLVPSFWTIKWMTWSFKFWRWSVSPFRFVYFVWNWRMMDFSQDWSLSVSSVCMRHGRSVFT